MAIQMLQDVNQYMFINALQKGSKYIFM